METLNIKFTKFDNRPWGFRLAGGYDFPEPLTVIRVSEESLAECMGLKVGDVIVSLNDQPIHELTHGQAHEALTLAGNNFVLGVRRAEDPNKLVEKIEDNVEPYMLPIENILFEPIEEKRDGTPDEVSEIKDDCTSQQSQQPGQEQVPAEVYPEKPRDENSEKIANTNLTDEEIAQLIVEEEEVLDEKGVLGVNFKKLRPRLPLLKQSKVLREIQQELLEKPRQIHELSLQSTFLQKPERPVPKPRRTSQSEDQKSESEVEGYKVVIKKQPKRTVTERLLAKGLIEPSRIKTPEPSSTAQASEVIKPPSPLRGVWSFSSCVVCEIEPYPIDDPQSTSEPTSIVMLPIDEEETTYVSTYATVVLPRATRVISTHDPTPTGNRTNYEPRADVEKAQTMTRPIKKTRLCRRGRYAKRCLEQALESIKPKASSSSGSGKSRPRLLPRAHYFERIVRDASRSFTKESSPEDNLLRVLMLASLANSLRDTYDTEILHRGSSRRNSRRSSTTCGSRRESNAYDLFAGITSPNTLQSRYAEGRRRLSVVSLAIADKFGNALRTDLARGIAFALVPCASALAFYLFNYTKRFNNNANE